MLDIDGGDNSAPGDVVYPPAPSTPTLCERMGVNVFEVRELINARPDRHVHVPGAGVGGHCLPKDSWLLKYGVKTYGQPADQSFAIRHSPFA